MGVTFGRCTDYVHSGTELQGIFQANIWLSSLTFSEISKGVNGSKRKLETQESNQPLTLTETAPRRRDCGFPRDST